MSVPPINALSSAAIGQVGQLNQFAANAEAETAGGASFINMVEQAMLRLNDSMNNADQLALLLAAGEEVDLHQVMIAMETASIGLQTAMQIRNKVVEAYREIMSMPL